MKQNLPVLLCELSARGIKRQRRNEIHTRPKNTRGKKTLSVSASKATPEKPV